VSVTPATKQRRQPDATSSEEPRCSQARRAPSTHAEVEAGAARRKSDARRRTDGWLGSFPQMRAYARQQATREQVKSQGCVSRGSSTREQENPEVRGGVGIANRSGSIVSSHKFTTSSSFYSSSIARARPQHLEETLEPPLSFFDPCVPEHHRRGKVDCCRHGSP
jgi:hypothetical protein